MTSSIRVLPVIDVLGGVAVHAIGGERSRYQPLRSALHPGFRTLRELGCAMRSELGLDQIYVADLDALQGGGPQWSAIAELLDEGLQLWLDLGVTDARDVDLAFAQLARLQGSTSALIIALESWRDAAALAPVVAAHGSERLIFSLDLKHGQPLTRDPAWGDSVPNIAAHVAAAGLHRSILLDLAQVGRSGGNWARTQFPALLAALPELEWFAGGGVRSLDDLRELAELGCAGALVGTALHQGSITGPLLREWRK